MTGKALRKAKSEMVSRSGVCWRRLLEATQVEEKQDSRLWEGREKFISHTTLMTTFLEPTGDPGDKEPYVGLRFLGCDTLPVSTGHQSEWDLSAKHDLEAGWLCIWRCRSSWLQKSLCSLLHFVQNYFRFIALRIDIQVQRKPLIWRNNESCAFLFQQLFEALSSKAFFQVFIFTSLISGLQPRWKEDKKAWASFQLTALKPGPAG